MSFEEKQRNEVHPVDTNKGITKIDKMSPDELLDLPEEAIQNFTAAQLDEAMDIIMHGINHLILDEHNRTKIDSRWKKYVNTFDNKLENDNNQ